MPEFLDENLAPEELKGGFEPTDKDDETFLLESIEDYPGRLPYDIELSDGAQIHKETSGRTTEIKSMKEESESFGEIPASAKDNLLDSDEETKPYEKTGLVADESEQVSYEKAGLVADESEQVSYEKAGLIADESEQVSYEKTGLVADESEQVSYEKAGLVADESEQVSYEKAGSVQDETTSVWDLFKEESKPAIEDKEITQETSIKDEQGIQETLEQEPIAAEEIAKKDIVESIPNEAFPKDIEAPPVEIKIADYNEEEFNEVLDEDFRKETEGELEQSRGRREKIEKESEDIVGELTTAEKEELQKDLDDGVERTDAADFIEIDLTAMKVRKPSELLANEMKEKVDFLGLLKTVPKAIKAKKVQKQKKAKKPKKVKGEPPITMESPEASEISRKEESLQVEEPQRWMESESSLERIATSSTEESETAETKKKKLVPIWVWFPAAAVILLFIAVGGYFLLSERFWSRKKPEVVKAEVDKKQESKNVVPPIEKKIAPLEPQQVVEKNIKAESKLEQTAKSDIKRESKFKMSLTQRVRTEPKIKTDLKPEKSPIAKVEKLTEPPVAKIIESVPLVEYSIQVFSSSEPDEANYWKNVLNKNGIDALIKIHKVRDVSVYCVRVGTFKNIDEARAYAKSKGFKNIWIDRIK